MALERRIIKELEFPTHLNKNLITQWADGIPLFGENDPAQPEWTPTPTVPIDISSAGYGNIFVKNEADPANPTRTIKDRAAWECATLYRDFARRLSLFANGSAEHLLVPRLSIVTAGNVGKALAHAFETHGLPPVKMLVDEALPEDALAHLKSMYADIYTTDLRAKMLTTADIKMLTNNADGIDITSVITIEPHAVFYDWHVHEAFNQEPDEIYIPYGSGRLMENYLTWQQRSVRNELQGRHDPRLKTTAAKVAAIDIFGAEPEAQDSIANKLTKPCNPFALYKKEDCNALRSFSFSGSSTDVYPVSEHKIATAYRLLQQFMPTEPSAAAGLALYMQRYERGLVSPEKKVLIVNTGASNR
jgi:threonine synthase